MKLSTVYSILEVANKLRILEEIDPLRRHPLKGIAPQRIKLLIAFSDTSRASLLSVFADSVSIEAYADSSNFGEFVSNMPKPYLGNRGDLASGMAFVDQMVKDNF